MRRVFSYLFMSLVAAVFLLPYFSEQLVNAIHQTNYNVLGSYNFHGFNTGNAIGASTGHTQDEVFWQGQSTGTAGLNAGNVNELVSIIRSRLYRTEAGTTAQRDQNQLGGAFIINTMLGNPPGTYGRSDWNRIISDAQGDFAEWESTVRGLDAYAPNCIEYKVPVLYGGSGLTNAGGSYYWNSAFAYKNSSGGNGVDHPTISRNSENEFYRRTKIETQQSIIFRDYRTGCVNIIAYIKQNCGNPMGPVALPPLENWEYGIDISNPGTQDPGDNFNITSKLINSTGTDGVPRPDWHNHIIRPTTGASYVSLNTGGNANRAGDTAGWNNFGPVPKNNNIPHTGNWSVNAGAYNQRICFKAIGSPKSGPSGTVTDWGGDPPAAGSTPLFAEMCFNTAAPSTEWHYTPSIAPLADRYPGEIFDVVGTINNDGSENGQPYTHTIHSWDNEAWLKPPPAGFLGTNPPSTGVWNQDNDARWTGLAGLPFSGADSRPNTGRWEILPNTPAGTRICFRGSVTPYRGNGATITGQAPPAITSPERCFRVLKNERFAMTSTVSPATSGVIQPGGTANFNVFVTNNGDYKARGGTPDVYPFAAPGGARNISCSFSVSGTAGGSVSGSPSCFASPAWNADAFSGNVSVSVPGGADIGDTVCLTASGTSLNGFSDGTDLRGSFTDTECYVVGIAPYLQVDNGDIWAGANFDATVPASFPVPPSCGAPTNNDSEIKSVTSDISGLWKGSFVEYAAFATGSISSFGSNNTPNKAGYLLTFANDNRPAYGEFTKAPKCIPNYFELLSAHTYISPDASTNNNGNVSSFSGGKQNFVTPSLGTFTLRGETNISGNRTVVVDGNLSIIGDVEFGDSYGSAGSLNVPSLVFVVSGDIFIDTTVNRVDAILISHGTIWTCASGGVATTKVAEGVCFEPLVINGAIIANRVNFMRTHEGSGNLGGVHEANSGPAEIINFSPEFYLSNPIFQSDLIPENVLRTVLVKDLPPIY